MSEIAVKTKDVVGSLKDLLTEEKLHDKVVWAAQQMRSLDLSMGGKGAAQVLEALVGVGKALPYVGAAIAIGLLVFKLGSEAEKSPEMLMLEEIKKQISDLHSKVDELPDKLQTVIDWNEVDTAIRAIMACQINQGNGRFDLLQQAEFELQRNVLTLKDYLTNTNDFMGKLALDVENIPAHFVARLARLWIPFLTAISLLCSMEVHKCTIEEIALRESCERVKKQYGFYDAEKSVKEHFDKLFLLHNGDVISLYEEGTDEPWNVQGCHDSWKGRWVRCTQKGSGDDIVIRRMNLTPQKFSDDAKSHFDEIIRSNDVVTLSSAHGFIYRFPGTIFTESNYCFSLDTQEEVKSDALGVEGMH